MSPSSINAFRLKGAAVQHTAHGVLVTFRGGEIKVILSDVKVSLDLESGGLQAGGEYTCRILTGAITSPPRRGEQMSFNGRKYTIGDIKDTISTPGEYVMNISAGSKI
jgi:hypothetical protein